jgi:hypothetical protein
MLSEVYPFVLPVSAGCYTTGHENCNFFGRFLVAAYLFVFLCVNITCDNQLSPIGVRVLLSYLTNLCSKVNRHTKKSEIISLRYKIISLSKVIFVKHNLRNVLFLFFLQSYTFQKFNDFIAEYITLGCKTYIKCFLKSEEHNVRKYKS